FLTGHPQELSHVMQIYPEGKSWVPHFSGQTLPKREGPDPVKYHATMLMLFKPW
ncbi:hypothetical protein SISNIDRAFT_394023, partial [Sistotremastrum niveocremeum HHB9708]